MPNLSSENWLLRKHEDKSIFGPVAFPKMREWARSAQIAPHDMVSEDGTVWTKAPMIPDLEMDFLVQLDADLFYGPTTAGAVLEFYTLGEISRDTLVINCVSSQTCRLVECEFFPEAEELASEMHAPHKGSLRANLQKRVRELEASLLEKQRRLLFAEDTIRRLEKRLQELETRAS
jgi:hypothetical protein